MEQAHDRLMPATWPRRAIADHGLVPMRARTDSVRAMRIPALLLLLGFCLTAALPLSAQTLAEVAKKQADRRKDAKTAPKAYTNKDLSEVPSTPAVQSSVPAAGPASAAPAVQTDATAPVESTAPSAAAAPAQSDVKDRVYWSKRIQQARAQLERDRVLADALQTRVNSLNTDFVNRDDPAQRAKVAADRDRAMQELDRLKKAVAADEKAIPAIEEEARRASVPPGWLR